MQYITEDLLSSIKLRSMMPISQATFQDADLVQLANEELQLKLVADIMRERENFFLTSQLVPVLAQVDTYVMPSRAIGNALRKIWMVPSNANKQEMTSSDYEIKGDSIVLSQKPNITSGAIQFDFYARPNRLVLTPLCAKINSVVSGGGLTTFMVDTDLSALFPVGSLMDVVRMTSPFLLWGSQVPIVTVTPTTIVVMSGLISDQAGNISPVIGDYVCATGTANIPQIPQEFHSVLAQMVANRCLWGLGDMNKYNLGMQTLKEDRENAVMLIRNRVETQPSRVNNKSGMVAAFSRRW